MMHPGPRHPDTHDIRTLMAPLVDELVALETDGLVDVEDTFLGDEHNCPRVNLHVFPGTIHADTPARQKLLRSSMATMSRLADHL